MVNFKREGNPSPAEGVHTNDEHSIDSQCHNRTNGERNVAETHEDIDEDGDEGEHRSQDSILRHFGSYAGAYLLRAHDGASCVVVAVLERIVVGLDETCVMKRLPDYLFYLFISICRIAIDHIVGCQTHCLALRGTYLDGINSGVVVQRANGLSNHFLHLFWRRVLLFEFDHKVATTREVDTFAQTTHTQGYKSCEQNDTKDSISFRSILEEVELAILQQTATELRFERQVEPLVLVEEMFEDDTANPNGGEEACANTDTQREGETADGACTNVVQNNGGDD